MTLFVVGPTVFRAAEISRGPAGATVTPRVAAGVGVDVRVLFRVGMAVLTVRLADILRRLRVAAHQVLSRCHGFEMARVHARVVAAKMVNLFAVRHGSVEEFTGEAVSEHATLLNVELPVAFTTLAARPFPTASLHEFYVDEEASYVVRSHAVKYSEVEEGCPA